MELFGTANKPGIKQVDFEKETGLRALFEYKDYVMDHGFTEE